MTLSFYLLNKFIKALIICLGLSFSVFFIFSLLGYLGESFAFKTILYLSFLNSFQIFTYIPSYLFILSFCIFIMNLKSKNELIIIKEYSKLSRLFLIVLPILFLFTVIDVEKEIISTKIENNKAKLLKSKNFSDTRVTITTEGDTKIYAIFSGYKAINKVIGQYLRVEIKNKKIYRGELSTNLNFYDNDLFSYKSVIYDKDEFLYQDVKKRLFENFFNYWSTNNGTIIKKDGKSLNSNFRKIELVFFYSFFYLCISIIFFSKKLLNRELNKIKIFFLILLIFLYYLLIPKIILNNFNHYFQITSILVLILIFLKIKKYE